MKIKRIIQLAFLTIAFYSSALLAQQDVSSKVHLGTRNKYRIGTPESPVFATEYRDFLNEQSKHDHPWIQSNYYDSSFMGTDSDWISNPKACIYRITEIPIEVTVGYTNTQVTLGRQFYYYETIPGHENDIIDAVYWQSVQEEFNTWRQARQARQAKEAAELAKNPTRQELCDYINFKIAERLDPSFLDKALEIQNRYPQAQGFDFHCNYDTNPILQRPNNGKDVTYSLWEQVESIVDAVNSTSDLALNRFVQRWGLVVSDKQDNSLNLPLNMPKFFALLDNVSSNQRQCWMSLNKKISLSWSGCYQYKNTTMGILIMNNFWENPDGWEVNWTPDTSRNEQ